MDTHTHTHTSGNSGRMSCDPLVTVMKAHTPLSMPAGGVQISVGWFQRSFEDKLVDQRQHGSQDREVELRLDLLARGQRQHFVQD